MKKMHVVALLGMFSVTASSLFGFPGKGFNSKTGEYQWDSGFHGTVTTIASDTVDSNLNPFPQKTGPSPYDPTITVQLAYEPGPDLSGNNAQSVVQGFDTNHRGKSKDKIEAVSIGFADITQYLRGVTSVVGEGTQGITDAALSPVGKKITIGIWQQGAGSPNVYDGKQTSQRRDNAIFLMDYKITGKDVGIHDADEFKINCPEYLLDPQPALTIGTGIPPSSSVRVATGGKVRVGDGSNVRPLKYYPGAHFDLTSLITFVQNPFPPVSSTHPDHRHISRAGNFVNQYGVKGPKPDPRSDYDKPFVQAPFSQYETKFTTIRLKDQRGHSTSVSVSGEFWVGFLIDITEHDLDKAQAKGWYVATGETYYDANGNYIGPQDELAPGVINGWDDIGYGILGNSLVDISAKGPGGISYAGLTTSGIVDPIGTVDPTLITPLQNNLTQTGAFNAIEVLGGFSPAVYSVPVGPANVGVFLDTFYAIRAIPCKH